MTMADPQATLGRALRAVRSDDPAGARKALADYAAYRRAGGPEPRFGTYPGDAVAGLIAALIAVADAGADPPRSGF